MTDRNNTIEREIRDEIRRAKRAPQREKRRGAARLLLWLLLLVAVLGVVGFAAANRLTGADSLRRLFSYRKVEQDADGRAELYRYDSDRSARYQALGKSLLIVSATRARLLGAAGEELWAETLSLAHPAVAVGGKRAAVYDVGGKTLYLLDESGLVRDMGTATENGLLSVSLNASDYLALTTLKDGCRAAVTAYDPAGEAVFTFHSSERYLSDARVLDDNGRLSVVSLGEADGAFTSTLTFFALDRKEPLGETAFPDEMILSLDSVDGRLAALGNDRVTLFRRDGSLSGSLLFPYPYLRRAAFGGDSFGALLLSRGRSGNALRLLTFDGEGQTLGALDARREILDISAAGKYLAVLYGDRLVIYTADLSEYAALEGTDYARRVAMRPDGTALLLGASRARLYVPR